MRNILVLTAVGSVLALGSNAIAAEPFSFGDLLHKVQSGGGGGPGAGGQGGGKGSAPSSREGGGGQDTGLGKGKDGNQGMGKGTNGSQGARPDKAGGDTRMRSGEKQGTRQNQRATERGGRTGVDVDVRGGHGYRGGADRRTRIEIDADRRRRSGGRDVDVNVRGGYGYRPSTGGVDCDQIVRRYSMCFRR
jgi:hypothetical protein